MALLSPANVGQDLEDVYLTAITAMDRKRVSLTLDFSNVIPSPAP